MNIIKEIAELSFILYVFSGIYVLKINSSHIMNRLFFLQCLSLAAWAFSAIVIYPSQNREQVFFWYKISSFGYGLYYALVLHLFLYFVKIRLSKLKVFFLYLPAVIVILATWFSYTLFEDFIFLKGQWKFIPAFSHAGFYFYIVYYFSYILVSILILLRWHNTAESRKEKLQARIMAATYTATFLACTITDFILPAFSFYKLPALAPVLLVINTITTMFAFYNYNFLVPAKDFFSSDFIFLDKNITFLVNSNEKILSANKAFCGYFGYLKDETIGKCLNDWFAADDSFIENVRNCSMNANTKFSGILKLLGNDNISFQADCSCVTDKFGDYIGTIIHLHEIEHKRKDPVSQISGSKIEQVIDYIKNNFTTDISRDELADAVNMHPDNLSRNFKKVTGKRLDEYITEFRIEEARKLLIETDLTIISISFNTGFGNVRTFNKIFRKIMHQTPSEYRLLNKKQTIKI